MDKSKRPASSKGLRLTAAGRLLTAIAERGSPDIAELARHLRVSVRRLDACREGFEPLDHETQMRLAALVIAIAPEHSRRAHALYAQAQAALRVEAGSDRRHSFYPREFFR